MTERPIILNLRELRDTLDGRMRMLVRPLKLGKSYVEHYGDEILLSPDLSWRFVVTGDACVLDAPGERCTGRIRSPFGKPGDILWVKERFACTTGSVYCGPGNYDPVRGVDWPTVIFKVDQTDDRYRSWYPSMMLKKRWARLWLVVKSTGVVRLHDIPTDEIQLMGVRTTDALAARRATAVQWDKEHSAWDGTKWASNPLVWTATFELATE